MTLLWGIENEPSGTSDLTTDVSATCREPRCRRFTGLASALFQGPICAALPVITWSPLARDLGTPVLRSFQRRFCDALAAPGGLIEQSRSGWEDFRSVLDGWIDAGRARRP